MLQTLNFNGARQVNAAGTFFRYESGSAGGADESIRVRADGQDLGIYWPGDSVELPDQRSTWDIIPTTQNAAGVVRVGNGRVNSARLVGNVRVIDAERDKVAAGVCYRAAPLAVGNAPVLQIFNPAGSGKNLFFTAVRIGTLTADSWGIRTTPTQYANAMSPGVNLDLLGPASIALVRNDIAAAVPVTPKFYASGFCQAASDAVIVFPRPVLVRPGNGFDVYANNNPQTIRTTFEWEEWPV